MTKKTQLKEVNAIRNDLENLKEDSVALARTLKKDGAALAESLKKEGAVRVDEAKLWANENAKYARARAETNYAYMLDMIRRKPVQSAVLVFGAGFILSQLMKRK